VEHGVATTPGGGGGLHFVMKKYTPDATRLPALRELSSVNLRQVNKSTPHLIPCLLLLLMLQMRRVVVVVVVVSLIVYKSGWENIVDLSVVVVVI
jgi:hypothetical protein